MPFNTSWPIGAVIYQIYPRSFKDTNSDGIGDLPGIIEKLDYLQELGVTALWLSPFYRSPMADFGYDIADYCDVDPIFGTIADARALIAAAHAHDLRIIIDLVPNHTSDQHAWFTASCQSRSGTYRDYYIWRDPLGYDDAGQPLPPNNWIEVFSGGSAWEWCAQREQFYLHSFNVHQPDLNWDNPSVRLEIQKVMRFWLDMGVDGFRVDAVNFISKDPSFSDNPVNESWETKYPAYGRLLHLYSQSGPNLHTYLSDMASVLREAPYAPRKPFMVTEGYPQTPDHISEYAAYYRGVDASVSAPFCFEGLELPWKAGEWTGYLRDYHAVLATIPDAVPAYAFSNHDNARPVSRRGNEVARSMAVLLLTLPGIVFIYNGDELGMRNGEIASEFIVDPGAADGTGRDPERTPMQWSADQNAGFSTAATTWLPVNEDYPVLNAATEMNDPQSFWWLYRNLCHLRRTESALTHGTIEIFETGNEALLGYIRRDGSNALMTVINFTDQSTTYSPNQPIQNILLSTHENHQLEDELVSLRPYEAVILQVS